MTENVGPQNTHNFQNLGWEDISNENDSNDFIQIDTSHRNSINTNRNQTLSNALNGATLERPKLGEDIKENLQKNISAHKSVNGSSIGRFFMGVLHTIKKIFTFSSDDSVKNQERKMLKQSFNTTFQLPQLPENKPKVEIELDVIEKAMGLKTNDAKEKPWPKNIYPNNGPRLSDIKQNPNLQDCWFLSSVGATLKKFGPDYIKGLIQQDETGKGYNVRMSDNIVHVPNEIISKSGKVSFSNSAPWVKILETAMQITLIQNYKEYSTNGGDPKFSNLNHENVLPDMAYKNALVGMKALLGDNINHRIDPNNCSLQQNYIMYRVEEADFKEAYNSNHMIVLGSSKSKGVSLRDGISPGHAVAVLDYNAKANKVTVLDPYGHTRVISMESIQKNYSLLSLGEKTNNNQ